jgi:Flp pilus assembly protein CpaB
MFVRSPRALALRTGAAVIAVATAALVASDLAALHRHAHDLGPPRDALVARDDLPVGTTIDASDVRMRRVHASQLPPVVLGDPTRAVGRVVKVPVLRGGFVGARNLAPRRRTGLDGAIPAGMRALRVVVTDALRPRAGAAVDVIASFEDRTRADATAPESATVVAHGVLVLTTDAARTAEGAAALGVTLLVTPHQARDLVFAATHGVVTVALVPPEDAHGS